MKKNTGRVIFALFALALGGAPVLRGASCDVVYRLWQDGENRFFQYGEDVVLAAGEEGHLYIHYQSQSTNPYTTSADIGAPRDFGVGGHQAKDIARVLRLGDHSARRGKMEFTAVAAGRTGLGYRITAVARPGRLEDIPAQCRTGQVRITVTERAEPSVPAPVPAVTSPDEAAHQLIVGLYTGILRRSSGEASGEAGDYPHNFFDRVAETGLPGLIYIAETMTASSEFHRTALSRTRAALESGGVSAGHLSPGVLRDQLLTDICQSLYGTELDSIVRRQMATNLASCLDGRGGSGVCKQLGRDLLSQRHYYDNHRDLLRHWRRY